MQWGFYRPGRTDQVINGRFEELHEKPMFKGLLRNKRCVVIVNGYYEWDQRTTPHKPFYVGHKNKDEPLYLACLYNNALSKTIGEQYNHFVVLTTDA